MQKILKITVFKERNIKIFMNYNKFKNTAKTYLDLEKQYNFYSSYHKNETNKFIHMVCIPLLIFTISIFGSYTGPIATIPGDSYFISDFNLTGLLCIIYSLYYMQLNFDLGLIISIILWTNQVITYWLCRLFPNIWHHMVFVHIFSWLMQIIGHKYYELNNPAFTVSITQSVLIAPFLVFIDFLDALNYNHNLEFIQNYDKETYKIINDKLNFIKFLRNRQSLNDKRVRFDNIKTYIDTQQIPNDKYESDEKNFYGDNEYEEANSDTDEYNNQNN